jgi:hypothetical protein
MAIRVYLTEKEAQGVDGVTREAGQQPYVSFPDIEAVPGERFHENGLWTYRENFSSKDGYDFKPGKYELHPAPNGRRTRATVLIEAQQKEGFVTFVVKGRFHNFAALADTVERMKYGKLPAVKPGFALKLLWVSILSQLKLYKQLRFV